MTYSMVVGKYKLIFSDTHFKDFRKKPTISVYDADTNSETKIASFNSQETFEWFVEAVVEADRKTEPLDKDINVRSKTEPQTEECPFDDAIPCEWVCTEYGNCKYKKDEPQTERSDGKERVMREIILEKRYPHSREEDITDAFMRGYEIGKEQEHRWWSAFCANCKTEPQTETHDIRTDTHECVKTTTGTDCSWK